MARVAINGLGRIGRATLKIVMDTPGLDLVAANDLGTPDDVAYLEIRHGLRSVCEDRRNDSRWKPRCWWASAGTVARTAARTPAVAVIGGRYRLRVHGRVHKARRPRRPHPGGQIRDPVCPLEERGY